MLHDRNPRNRTLRLSVLLTLISSFLTQFAYSQCGCTHIIPLNPATYTIDGATFKAIDGHLGVKPGEKVCFASGTRPDILIKNMVGTPAQPITITNMCDGKITISANYATTGRLIIMSGCSYVHVTGAANPAEQYGIEITNGIQGIDFRDFSTHAEADHLYVHDISYSAINAKTDPTCDPATWRGNGFIMRDVYFHHNYIKNTLGEGFYVGDSHYHTTFPVTCGGVVIQTQETSIMGVEIAYNKLENIGRDGIQVGSAVKPDGLSKIQGCFIHHNTVQGFGHTNEYAQQSGLQINPGTDTECYNNVVNNGTGFALFAGGEGGSHFYNNILSNAVQGGIICASYLPYDPSGFVFSNNILIGNAAYGIYMLAESATQPNLFVNNIIVANPTETGFLYVRLNNPPAIKWSEANNIKTTNLASLKFVNAAAGDYHLLTGSPAIDAGQDMTSHAITFDLDDKPRPKGTKFDAGPYEFQPAGPTSMAGPDQIISLPTTTVTLPGSGTSATGITGYSWTQKSGAACTLVNASLATLTVTGLAAGSYVFELLVTDASGSSFDDVGVTVQPAAVNKNPTANAGVDKIVVLPANTLTINGIGTDTDGSIASYSWTETSGPSATLGGAGTANLALSNLVQGVYTFQLLVTDNQGATNTDAVTVTVNPATVNQLPTVNAGVAKTVYLPSTSVAITATAGDADGTIASISWVKKTGAAVTITPTNALSVTASGLAVGLYTLTVTVTDNSGGTASSDVSITVLNANQPPTSLAGPDRTVTLPTNTVTLNGVGFDNDGTVASYGWVEVSGPNIATLANSQVASLAVSNLIQGTYIFGFTVTDNQGATGYDEASVLVSVTPPPPNQPPLAFAGGNQSFSLPTSSINLYGSGFDPDGSIVSYSWVKSNGGPATLTNANQATLSLSGLITGQYKITLTVTDNLGATNSDVAFVTVSDLGTNIPPVADAGQNKLIKLPQTSVVLEGNGFDADGTIAGYSWSQVSGAASTISTPLASSTLVGNLAEGDYVFRLMVTDNKSSTDFDDVTVHVVSAAANLPPTVNAGPDLTVSLPVNSVTINATASDDGTIVKYSWVKLSGPAATLVDPAVLNLALQDLIEGIYTFQLTVTDNNGASVFDVVRVLVLPGSFQPPTVSAGSDQQITLPTNQISLTGTASSPNSTISSVAWVQVSGPASTLSGAGTTTLQVSNMSVGTYMFKFTATDANALSASANVQVKVNPVPPDQPPVVTADLNQVIKLPINSITLTGTASDPDGTVASIKWTQTNGPNTATLQNTGTLTLTASNMVAGSYVFRLSATDDEGVVGYAEVLILVSDPSVTTSQSPVAYAGPDITLTLPENFVQITGAGASPDATIKAYGWEQISGTTASFLADTSVLKVMSLTQGTYAFRLTITDSNLKTASDTVDINVTGKGQDIPKFFSPNHDGIGEFWVFKNVDSYKTCKLSVFARSGQIVYEAAPYTNTWDGTYNGKPLSDGDYYYNLKCSDGNVNGALRIIR